jgi:mono/diheme cytochrome c family protein
VRVVADRGLRLRLAVAALAIALPVTAPGETASFGNRLFHEKADCQFCHGVNGDGHGDPRSAGKGSDLHATKLDRQQLIEVIRCGRPGAEMPHFDKYAFEDDSCFGLSAAQLGAQMPPEPHSTSLTLREIEALADYILTTYKGR